MCVCLCTSGCLCQVMAIGLSQYVLVYILLSVWSTAGAYYPAQPQFTPSVQAAPVIMNPAPQQQQPPPQPPQHIPTKRERKQVLFPIPLNWTRDSVALRSHICFGFPYYLLIFYSQFQVITLYKQNQPWIVLNKCFPELEIFLSALFEQDLFIRTSQVL